MSFANWGHSTAGFYCKFIVIRKQNFVTQFIVLFFNPRSLAQSKMKLIFNIFVVTIFCLVRANSTDKEKCETKKMVPLYFKLKPDHTCHKNFTGSTEEGSSTKSNLIKQKFDVLQSDVVCSVQVCAQKDGSVRFPYPWADGVARFILTDPASHSIYYKQSKAIPVPLNHEPNPKKV